MTRRFHRTCEECGQRAYCREDKDGLMVCEECKDATDERTESLAQQTQSQ